MGLTLTRQSRPIVLPMHTDYSTTVYWSTRESFALQTRLIPVSTSFTLTDLSQFCLCFPIFVSFFIFHASWADTYLTLLFSGTCVDFQKPLFKRNVTSLEDLHPGTRLSGRVTNMTSFGAFVDCGVGRDGLVHNSSMGRFKGKVGLGDLVEVTVKSVDIQKQHIGLILTDISSRFDPQLLVSIGNLSQACARWKEMYYCWGNKIVNNVKIKMSIVDANFIYQGKSKLETR